VKEEDGSYSYFKDVADTSHGYKAPKKEEFRKNKNKLELH
jgi:hypothetical protein